MSALHPARRAVTDRIIARSRDTRADCLRRMDEAATNRPGRAKLSCANWAHAFAGQTIADKLTAHASSSPSSMAPDRSIWASIRETNLSGSDQLRAIMALAFA